MVEKGDLLLYHKHMFTSCYLHATGCKGAGQAPSLSPLRQHNFIHFTLHSDSSITALPLPSSPATAQDCQRGPGARPEVSEHRPPAPYSQAHTEGVPLPCSPTGSPFLLPPISALGHAPLSVCPSLTRERSRNALAPEPRRCREASA